MPNFSIFRGYCSEVCELDSRDASKKEWAEYHSQEAEYRRQEIKYYEQQATKQAADFEKLKKQEWNLETKAALKALINKTWCSKYADINIVKAMRKWLKQQPAIQKAKPKKIAVIYTDKKPKKRFRHWFLLLNGIQTDKVVFDAQVDYETAKKMLLDRNKSGRYDLIWREEKEQIQTKRFWPW